jgi:hypothetical protein
VLFANSKGRFWTYGYDSIMDAAFTAADSGDPRGMPGRPGAGRLSDASSQVDWAVQQRTYEHTNAYDKVICCRCALGLRSGSLNHGHTASTARKGAQGKHPGGVRRDATVRRPALRWFKLPRSPLSRADRGLYLC